MLKLTELTRAETQPQGPPQTHVPGTGTGEPEKYNKGPALKELRGWSGCWCSEDKTPLAASPMCVLIVGYFTAGKHKQRWRPTCPGLAPRGCGTDQEGFYKGGLSWASDSLAPPPQLSICRRQSQSQGDAVITTSPITANSEGVLLIKGAPAPARGAHQRFSACAWRRCPASARGLIRGLSSRCDKQQHERTRQGPH